MDGQYERPSSEGGRSEELLNTSIESLTQKWVEDTNKRTIENMTKLEGQMEDQRKEMESTIEKQRRELEQQQNAIEELRRMMATMSAAKEHEHSNIFNAKSHRSVFETWQPSDGENAKPVQGAKKGSQNTRTHVTRLEEYELEQFSSQEKNELITRFKNKILTSMRASPMAANAVWVTLEKGSLVTRGEINGEAGDGQWPTEDKCTRDSASRTKPER